MRELNTSFGTGMRIKAVALGVILTGTALTASALNLGRVRGAAWIGQPLELQIPVQLDAGQSDTGLCAEVDLFQGDIRQEASRVQLTTEATNQPDTFNLKIVSAQLVDEPVVTVYLRAGCGQKTTRKYVLLADFPSEPTTLSRSVAPTVPVVPAVSASAASEPVATKSVVQPVAPSTGPVTSTKSTASKAVAQSMTAETPKEPAKDSVKEAPKQKEKEAQVKSSPAKPSVKADKPAKPATPEIKVTGKPRLRLDPVETLTERVKTLEATTTQSAAQEELARDAQRMQQLQSDLRTLLDQAVKNEASLAAMRERLEKAEADRVPVALVYGLVGLVGLCIAALAYLWTRRRPVR